MPLQAARCVRATTLVVGSALLLACSAKPGPPPLTPEYQAIRDGYLAQREQGVLAGDPPATCLPPGMPRVMTMSFPMELIVTPKVTYIYADWESQVRRVYTDGR